MAHTATKEHGVFFHAVSVVLWVWALSLLAVMLWGLLVSFADGFEYAINPSKIFHETFTFANYKKAFTTIEYSDNNYFDMIFNSVWFSAGSTFARVFVTTISAYVVARYNFKGKKLLYGFVILQMMLPIYGTTVANFKLMNGLGLFDTPLFLISMGAGHGTYFLILYGFFKGLPSGFEESARLDGAGEFRITFKIMLPLAKNVILAVFIIYLLMTWNDYSTVLLFLPSYPTLAAGLYRYKMVAAYTLDIPTYFAGIFLSAMPMVIMFIVFNKQLLSNLTLGGLKG